MRFGHSLPKNYSALPHLCLGFIKTFKNKRTPHHYGTQDSGGEANDEPFDPCAVTERGGIQDLRGNNGRKSHRFGH